MKPTILFSALVWQGLMSARHALAIGPGGCYDAQNNRKDVGGVPRVREGTSTAVTSAGGLPTGTFKGGSEIYDDGTYAHVLQAWKETADGKIHVWHKKQTLSTGVWDTNWVEVTKESGKFGDSTLTEPKNGRIQFIWCEAKGQSRLLASGNYHAFSDAPVCKISDGTSTRILDLYTLINGPALGDTDSGLGHAKPIPPPKGNMGCEWDVYAAALMSSAATPTGSGAGDWGTVNDTGNTWVFTTAGTVGGSDTASISFDSLEVQFASYTSDTDYEWPNQLILVAHATDRNFWDTVTCSIAWKPVNSGAYSFTGGACPGKPLVIPTNVSNYELVVYDLPDLLPEQADELEFNGIQFETAVGTPVSTTATIYAIAFAGAVPGGTEYSLARRSITTNVHSPAVTVHNTSFKVKNTKEREKNTGLLNQTDPAEFNGYSSSTIFNNAPALPAGFLMPLDSRVYYTPKIKFSNPHTGELSDNAADGVVIYRREPGETDFYRVDRYSAAQYTNASGWAFVSGTASSTLTYTDVVASEYREYADRAPANDCAPPPPFTSGASSNGRSFVTQDNPSSTNVKISEYNQPLRFSDDGNTSPDSKSAFNITVSGETGKAVGLGSSGGVPATVYVFTDKNAYNVQRLQGDLAAIFQLVKVSARGCSSGGSVCDVDGELSWLDKDRDFRIGGQDVSRTFVSDKLYAIPDAYVGIVDAVFWKGRVRLAYPTAATTENKRTLVWNNSGQWWDGYDTFPAGKEPQQWLHYNVDGANLLYYFASDGAIYEYEKSGQTTDAGTAIAWVLETGEYHNDSFMPVIAQRMGAVTDKVSVTLTTTRTTLEPSDTKTGSLLLSTGSNRTWKYDDKGSGSGVQGAESVGIRLKFNGSFSVACSFYALVGELSQGFFGGADG